jgi:hypothetical protein
MALYAGEGVGSVTAILPAAAVIAELMGRIDRHERTGAARAVVDGEPDSQR